MRRTSIKIRIAAYTLTVLFFLNVAALAVADHVQRVAEDKLAVGTAQQVLAVCLVAVTGTLVYVWTLYRRDMRKANEELVAKMEEYSGKMEDLVGKHTEVLTKNNELLDAVKDTVMRRRRDDA